MTKNNFRIKEVYNNKATVSQLYELVEDVRKEMATNTRYFSEEVNRKFDELRGNDLKHIQDDVSRLCKKVDDLEKKVYFASGILATIMFALKFFVK